MCADHTHYASDMMYTMQMRVAKRYGVTVQREKRDSTAQPSVVVVQPEGREGVHNADDAANDNDNNGDNNENATNDNDGDGDTETASKESMSQELEKKKHDDGDTEIMVHTDANTDECFDGDEICVGSVHVNNDACQ